MVQCWPDLIKKFMPKLLFGFCILRYQGPEERLFSLISLKPTAYVMRRSALDILETEVRAELDKDGVGTSPSNRNEPSCFSQRSSSIKPPHLVLAQMFLITIFKAWTFKGE
jgi:hypothetical protein